MKKEQPIMVATHKTVSTDKLNRVVAIQGAEKGE